MGTAMSDVTPAQASAYHGTVVIIPAYNEEGSLPQLLEDVVVALPGAAVVVVDDGSADATGEVARSRGATVLQHPFNMGYGAALQTGFRWALERGADYAVQLDADGQHLPAEMPPLLDAVRCGECDLALGSRFLAETDYQMGGIKRLGRDVFRAIARLWGLDLTDPTSGFQALNREVLEIFVSPWYPADYPDVDVLLLVHRRGLRLREFAVQMAPGWRESTMHSGLRPLYYCYRMLLSLWALGGVPRSGPV
jgi:glycosyltransferase involved in cell wall biosynthesis